MAQGLRVGWRRKLNGDKASSMLQDVFEARHDLAGLARQYGLEPTELAGWANDAENRTVLQGLCVLADLQTQLMLSRYRQLAVTELIRQATGGGEGDDAGVSAEQARKACVDLLRADLKPLASGKPGSGAGGVGSETSGDAAEEFVRADADLRALRAAMYGNDQSTDRDQASPSGQGGNADDH